MAWTAPKTDWKVTYGPDGEYTGDFFNVEDYDRIKQNIEYLREYAYFLYGGFTMRGMVAVTVEALVEYAKTFGKAILEKQWKTAATQAGAVALGVSLCFGVGADFYAALGVNFSVAWLGIALTGVFASRGANYVSDLVKKLQALGAAKTE